MLDLIRVRAVVDVDICRHRRLDGVFKTRQLYSPVAEDDDAQRRMTVTG